MRSTSGRVHHAFLFTGTRGVGKTTVARILAKCLNCETRRQRRALRDMRRCREIDAGRFVDLIEVDAASRTKVDDTRELLDNVQYAPTRSRYKVYLIDEVHMLSAHSFNALLKTLEEPPPHVKFLLATTDPQKLPVTVLSRCLQFNLKRLSVALIAERMRHILEAERHRLRARRGAAHRAGRRRQPARCALAARSAARLRRRRAQARPMRAPCSARSPATRWCASRELLAAGDAPRLMNDARALEECAPDYAQVLDQLAALLARVALKQSVADYAGDELHAPELLERLAGSSRAEDVQLFYQTAILGRRDLALAPDPRTGFRDDAAAHAGLPACRGARPRAPPRRARCRSPLPPRTRSRASRRVPPLAARRCTCAPRRRRPPGAQIVNQLDLAGAARQLANHCVLLGREG